MSGPYQRRDLSNCGAGRLRVAINCGVLSVKIQVSTMKKKTRKIQNQKGLIPQYIGRPEKVFAL